jgi:hypothetical protein
MPPGTGAVSRVSDASIVVIFRPVAAETGNAQERAGAPSTSTVQARIGRDRSRTHTGEAKLVAKDVEQRSSSVAHRDGPDSPLTAIRRRA